MKSAFATLCLLFVAFSLAVTDVAYAEDRPPVTSTEIVFTKCLGIGRVRGSGISPINPDPIEEQIVLGEWSPPNDGQSVTLSDGTEKKWEIFTADEEGWFSQEKLRYGYAYVSAEVQQEVVMILEAEGHSMVYVNGEPRMGDFYKHGYTRVPILLKKGRNEFLFRCSGGGLKVRLVRPKSSALLNPDDTTQCDFKVGEKIDSWSAIVVVNPTTQFRNNLIIKASLGGNTPTVTRLPSIPPLSIRKVGFRITGDALSKEGTYDATIELMQLAKETQKPLDSAVLKFRCRGRLQTRKKTFISDIDGSVQYYAVKPAQTLPGDNSPKALFLTLHNAPLEAIDQVDAYSGKRWGHLIAPTNRRPYGFDWEDWGRLDAMEVLDHAMKEFVIDPKRVYLTGYSTGGHGAWHLGSLFPDRFGAIGPSAGWTRRWLFSQEESAKLTEVEQLLKRCMNPSDTFAHLRNYLHHGVYILHGEKDKNDRVDNSRAMYEKLREFHRDYVYHEEPEVGQWWDVSDEPGTDCVDWAPMFDFFARHSSPDRESVRQVEFITANPGVSAWSHWAGIEAQTHLLQPSSINIRFDPWKRRFVGTTKNVSRLCLSVDHLSPDGKISIELDAQRMENIPYPTVEKKIWLSNSNDRWSILKKPSPALKSPRRYGTFKDAFRNRMVFVYGTMGTLEENRWAFAKARFDAEQLWYRGNGAVDIISDLRFEMNQYPDRNIILYGNARTNVMWDLLLAGSPVQVRRGSVTIGRRELSGTNLACLFIRPRPGSETASVGVVSGSGIQGMRLTDRVPYLSSGRAYPDVIVFGTECLRSGSKGIRAAGFFGIDWGVKTGEFVWQE